MRNKAFENLTQRSSFSVQLSNPLWLLLVFYIGVPLTVGFITGWMQSGRAVGWSKWGSLYFWMPVWFTSWFAVDLATRLIHLTLGRFIKSFMLLLVLGSVVGSLLVWPVFIWHIEVSERLFGATSRGALPLMEPTLWLTALRFFDDAFAGIFFWLAINYIFAGPLGMTRFGYERKIQNFLQRHDFQSSEAPAEGKRPTPLFLKRLKKEIGQDVVAVSAEQHYLRVYTPLGNDLILYRLSDAILELESHGGLQIHRSHWVKLSAVEEVVTENRNLKIVLSGGLKLPVGRSHQSKVRHLKESQP